jgi:signal transduction histidine kinase
MGVGSEPLATVEHAAAERRADRWRSLERGVRAIAGALDGDEVLVQVRQAALPELGDVLILDRWNGSELERLRVEAIDPALMENVRPLLSVRRCEKGTIATVLATGRAERLDEGTEPLLLAAVEDGPGRAAVRKLGAVSALVLPLASRGRTVGMLTLVNVSGRRRHGDEDLALGESLAQAAATGLDNARLFAEARASVRDHAEQLAIAAHDLHNPLLALRLEADRILFGGAERAYESAARIGRVVHSMSRLVTDLLDYATFERGRVQVTAEALDPVALVQEALDTFAPIAEAAGVALYSPVPVEELPRVRGDRSRIQQVFSNLLGNAITHGRPERVVVTAADCGDEVRFSVEDSGRGLSEEDMARLFRVGAQPYGRDGSTGLGLAICRRVVEAHGGWIWAESTPGTGTTVHFTLPAAPSHTIAP